jgi:sugar phosphate permease
MSVKRKNMSDHCSRSIDEGNHAVINTKCSLKFTKILGYLFWSMAAAFYAFQFIFRGSVGVLSNSIIQDLNFGESELSQISSAYYMTYALIQPFAGMLLDKYETFSVIVFSMGLCILGGFLFAIATDFSVLYIARMIIGMGGGFALLSCFKISNCYFYSPDPRERETYINFFSSASITIGIIGSMVGMLPLAYFASIMSWRSTIFWISGIGFGIWLLMVFFMLIQKPGSIRSLVQKKLPINLDCIIQQQKNKTENCFWKNFKALLKNPTTWWLGFYQFFTYTFLSIMIDMWATPYLQNVYHIDAVGANTLISWMPFGLLVGLSSFAWFANHGLSYLQGMSLYSCSMTLLFTFFVFMGDALSLSVVSILFFIFGFLQGGMLLSYNLLQSIRSPNISGTANGIHNGLCMLSGFLFQPFVGWMISIMKNASNTSAFALFLRHGALWMDELSLENCMTTQGSMPSDASIYRISILLIPIFLGISALMIPWIYRAVCKNKQDITESEDKKNVQEHHSAHIELIEEDERELETFVIEE